MARYVLLRIDDDREAGRLIEDAATWLDSPLLTPCQENTVHAVVVGADDADRRHVFKGLQRSHAEYLAVRAEGRAVDLLGTALGATPVDPS